MTDTTNTFQIFATSTAMADNTSTVIDLNPMVDPANAFNAYHSLARTPVSTPILAKSANPVAVSNPFSGLELEESTLLDTDGASQTGYQSPKATRACTDH